VFAIELERIGRANNRIGIALRRHVVKRREQQRAANALVPLRFRDAGRAEKAAGRGVVAGEAKQLPTAHRQKTGDRQARERGFTFARPAGVELGGYPLAHEPFLGGERTSHFYAWRGRRRRRKGVKFDQ
jgi:hypothetical protein